MYEKPESHNKQVQKYQAKYDVVFQLKILRTIKLYLFPLQSNLTEMNKDQKANKPLLLYFIIKLNQMTNKFSFV